MRKIFFLALGMVAAFVSAQAEAFEDAFSAVANLGPGWNLGNTLDSHSGTLNDDGNYETAWGQPKATRALIHMFKEAGFNTIRVPVTWYPYADGTDNYQINSAWMARVKEVVDYVIDEGMYCILNTHHDSGTHDDHHQIAMMDPGDNSKAYGEDEFVSIWTQIATTFKDYGPRLLFEGYNEILTADGNWGVPSGDSHKAINRYASVFVSTVRGTGGNNPVRNLIINTYAASDDYGNISKLVNPEKEVTLTDSKHHIICEVHMYPATNNYKGRIDDLFSNIQTYFVNQQSAPCIIGEWGCWEQTQGTEKQDNNSVNITQFSEMAFYLTSRCKADGVGAVMWMLLSEEKDREVPQFSTNYHGKDYSKVKDAIIRAWYSTDCKVKFASSNSSKLVGNDPDSSNQWTLDAEFGISGGTVTSEGLTGTSTITAPKGYKISGVTAISAANVTIGSQSVASGDTYVPQTPATSINITSSNQITDLRFLLVTDDTYEETHHNDFCTVVGTRDADTPVNFIAYENGAWYANEIKLCDAADHTSAVAVNADKFSFSRDYVDSDAATNGYWQPLCLPVSVPYESWSMFASEILDFTGVDEVDGDVTLTFDKVVGPLAANHPYIFKPATSKIDFVINPGSTVQVSDATSPGSITKNGYTLMGTYSKIQDLSVSAYALWNGAFHHPSGSGVELKPFRVYLTVPSGNSAPARIRIAVGNEESGIEDISVDHVADDAYYDIMGRRVECPTSGLYIQHGRKIYIR